MGGTSAIGHVATGVDAADVGSASVVDDDPSAVVGHDSDGLETEIVGVGNPTGCHQNGVDAAEHRGRTSRRRSARGTAHRSRASNDDARAPTSMRTPIAYK